MTNWLIVVVKVYTDIFAAKNVSNAKATHIFSAKKKKKIYVFAIFQARNFNVR